MSEPDITRVTQLLLAWNAGNPKALEELTPVVYEQLRNLARNRMRAERADHTLQTTALVHEAFIRLIDRGRVSWRDKIHFFGAASQIMRRVLVDHARGKLRAKRGARPIELALDEGLGVPDRSLDVLDIHESLLELSSMDERQARIVELRFFGGLSIEETAEFVGTSPMTVKREWAVARAWLAHQLSHRRTSGRGPVATN